MSELCWILIPRNFHWYWKRIIFSCVPISAFFTMDWIARKIAFSKWFFPLYNTKHVLNRKNLNPRICSLHRIRENQYVYNNRCIEIYNVRTWHHQSNFRFTYLLFFFAGLLYEKTQNYDATILFTGGLCVATAIIYIILPIYNCFKSEGDSKATKNAPN